jgi:osmotically-inducible protein OsmY
MAIFANRLAVIITVMIIMIVSLSSCTAVVGAGATVGVAAAQERGIKGRARDLHVETLILKKYINAGLKLTTTIGVEVYKGRVLLTGATKDLKLADNAVNLAWKVNGVREVINEIQVNTDTTATDYAHDTWITTQLKSKLALDKSIIAINYSVETVNRTIYLIGIAQNRSELTRVIAHANGINRVINVVNHVELKKRPYEES